MGHRDLREARPTLQDTGSTDRSTVQAGPGDGVTTHAHPRSRRAEGQRSSMPILYTGCSQLSSTALRMKETRGKTYGTCTQPGGIVIREWSDSGKFATGHHGRAAVAVPRRDYPDPPAFNEAINAIVARHPIDLVVLAGFLSLYDPAPALVGRVMNVHPALLPAFGGRGFYGEHVHRAVLESGVKLSGCTVHFADACYDHGPIILQAAVPVEDDDTVESLAARVFAAECRLYPQAIQLFA